MTSSHQTTQNTKNTTSQTSTNAPQKTVDVQSVIDDQIRFEQEVARAQIQQKRFPDQDVFIEVGVELFNYLASNQPTPFLMYKDVRVIRQGEKEKVDKIINRGESGI